MSNPNAAPMANPNDPRYQIDVGRYWAGVGATVAVAALIGLVTGALLFLIIKSTPRPLAFFGWIMALATAVLNLIIGIAVWSLLAGVARMTTQLAAAGTQMPPQSQPPGTPPVY